MKTAAMEAVLNDLTQQMFGRQRTGDQCVTCGSKSVKATDFKDALSREEFKISHMCQKCQDETWGEDDGES